MKTAVFDTCVLIRLFKVGVLDCLVGLFETIYIPEAVKDECRDQEIVRAINHPPFEIKRTYHILPIGLGRGEREAISLAFELGVRLIFTDDEKAIRKALTYNLEPFRTFRLLILAKDAGLIPSVKSVLDRMRDSGEGIEEDIYLQTLRLSGESNE